MSIFDRALVSALPVVPRAVVRRVAERYIAGRRLADACRVVKELNEGGKMATIDVLGEEIERREEALRLVGEYLGVLDAIEREGLDANVSVKPTGLGLKVDRDFCRANLGTLARAAGEQGNFVRIDMEDSSTTDETLAIWNELRDDGLQNVGVVLQASLRRSVRDARALAAPGVNVRVCKGIYIEPPDVAYQDPHSVRTNFVRLVEELVEGGAYVGIASHDEWVLEEALRLVDAYGLEPDAYEFQMLLGVRPDLGDRLVRDGHRLRIYVPYGEQWYEYCVRRLQENPRIATHVARDTVRALAGR